MSPKRLLTVSCTKANGKLKLFDLDAYNRAFSQFGDGEELMLTIESVGKKRTEAQNRFFWGPVLDAFLSLGYEEYDREDLKTELCLRFLPREHRGLDGTITIVPGSTSDLDVNEFSEFIEACIRLAAQMGAVVQDADQWRHQIKRKTA